MKPNKDKIVQALNYLSLKGKGKLHTMKAYKLLWLADRFHMRQYGRTITYDNYFAMPHGVVPSFAKDILDDAANLIKDNRDYIKLVNQYCYKSIKPCNEKVFSKTDIEVLNLIYDKFGELNHKELSELSHTFPEWKRFEKRIADGPKKSYEIKTEDFFINHDDESGIFMDDEESIAIVKNYYDEISA
jgi:uncharacterized phage-associated protein